MIESALAATATWLAAAAADAPFIALGRHRAPGLVTTNNWPPECDRFHSGKCGPAVVIAGAKKCGTNSIAAILGRHPWASFRPQSGRGKRMLRDAGARFLGENWWLDCGIALREVPWTSSLYGCGNGSEPSIDAYERLFEPTDWATSFAVDRSPLTMAWPQAAARLATIAPHAKVVMVVCDPVQRAWSGINHYTKRWVGTDPVRARLARQHVASIGSKVLELVAKYGGSYHGMLACLESGGYDERAVCREVLLPGLYPEQVRGFTEALSPGQVIVIRAEWLFQNQTDGAEALYRALAVPAAEVGGEPQVRMTGAAWATVVRPPGHAPPVHRNKGARVNPVYVPITEMPPELNATLASLYSGTVEWLDSHFG